MTPPPGRRVVLVAAGELCIETFDSLDPRPGELLIAPDAVGICRTDIELFHGTMTYLGSGFTAYPIVPGHEWTGIVLGVGPGVSRFSAGDRVVGECSIGCGTCPACMSGAYHLCPRRQETGIVDLPGGLTTHMKFPAASAHRLPPSVSAANAALIEPLAVAYRAIRRAGAARTDPLAIVGAGPIGLLCALVARAMEIADVVIVEIDPVRREFAEQLGFSTCSAPDVFVPKVVEASGTAGGVAAAVNLCAAGGTVVLLGLTGSPQTPLDSDALVVRDVTLRGSLGSPGVWPATIAMVADGSIQPSAIVTHEFTLDETATAFEHSQRGSDVQKVLIRPTAPDAA